MDWRSHEDLCGMTEKVMIHVKRKKKVMTHARKSNDSCEKTKKQAAERERSFACFFW
ncbi:hypothetical protein [Paenibacillus sp. XY044]|uniref:hypothetical protein n=1 Tax=Paenibacillus sp. XY044 TaxID=2026089 RepID=UPI0015C66EEA|nr:hypothetical protein [Paenibacillus sp. XY044]